MELAMRKSSKQSARAATIHAGSAEGPDTQPVSGRDMMQAVLSRPRTADKTVDPATNRINGVVIGELAEQAQDGQPMVSYPGCPANGPVSAISTESMTGKEPGCAVALGFVDGNPERPIILGLIQRANIEDKAPEEINIKDSEVNVRLDGETMTLSADKEIVLKCGKSSITLTRAGKIIVKGAYLSNHATGVNRIKGGSVQIN